MYQFFIIITFLFYSITLIAGFNFQNSDIPHYDLDMSSKEYHAALQSLEINEFYKSNKKDSAVEEAIKLGTRLSA